MSALTVHPLYITMLRDPIDRIVSLYYFWRSHSTAYIERYDLRGPRLATQLTLAEFVEYEAPETTLNIRNGQAGQFLNGLRGSPGLSDEELLETAKQRLDECVFVGITEEFVQSIDLLCYIFDWQRPDTLRCVNESSANEQQDERYEPIDRPPLEEPVRQRLIELNGADIPLYAYARDRFSRMRQDMAEELAAEDADTHRKRPLLAYRFRRVLSELLQTLLQQSKSSVRDKSRR